MRRNVSKNFGESCPYPAKKALEQTRQDGIYRNSGLKKKGIEVFASCAESWGCHDRREGREDSASGRGWWASFVAWRESGVDF